MLNSKSIITTNLRLKHSKAGTMLIGHLLNDIGAKDMFFLKIISCLLMLAFGLESNRVAALFFILKSDCELLLTYFQTNHQNL